MADHADEMYGYPRLMIPNKCNLLEDSVSLADQLTEYFMNRYSHVRGLGVYGIIIGDNAEIGGDFAYLVWTSNDLGEETTYIDPENIKRLK